MQLIACRVRRTGQEIEDGFDDKALYQGTPGRGEALKPP
ncbi:hypothetical protein NBCG_04148 [Nocardioidaceae bacterium Broad-1]|nr:hypothetical protein NBCG_04148 [Nocardioidaceae bacterium Broad-1]